MYCRYCGKTDLTEKDFFFDKQRKTYKKSCKSCTAVRRALSRDKYNRRRRQYYQENKEKLAAQAREYYKSNEKYREKRLKQFENYYLANRKEKAFNSAQDQKRQILPIEEFDQSRYSELLRSSRSEKSSHETD